MSTAPTDPTYGTPLRAIAPSRSGPAENTPPTRWSAISVVVMSRTAAIRPESTSFSIDCPPVPVAWNTSGSNRACERARETRDERRRDPEHRQPDERPVVHPVGGVGVGDAVTDHAGECVGGVAEHLTRDPVEAGDVGDRVHHRDVGRADVHADVTRGDRRHHHLRHTDRQGAHRWCHEGGTARTACAEDPCRGRCGSARTASAPPTSPRRTTRGRR